ncbi:choline transporter-like protein 1 [Tribolium castaneum]|uniref:Choline transporter-like protein n=1 Tax=Tribolium castaneum TaxID=7070 RepID=A0A139W8N9_TRICA|nr:PREDICTED: choline transporter-like protein 1 [Tribolium castaneum]XP_015840370.1 PREDICTED: choline transporter-like protein 1 [Tribolium castaneum]KXZ75648.1 Choline transporter-like protein 1 [Tribolium castaneum]|eukprot:XP_008199157.1 PREDICTED: choline transporter-like protein 1 [Tribolium castaneum]
MGNSSSITKPEELVRFRKLNTSFDDVDIPARPENRTLTDKKGFVIFGICILLLLPFVIYALTKSDLRHLDSGYDDCGNFCGYQNEKIEGISCSGKDYTAQPFSDNLKCVTQCPKDSLAGVCVDEEAQLDDIVEDSDFTETGSIVWRFIVSILITISLSIVVLVLLRFIPAIVVWSCLVLTVLMLIAITFILWFSVARAKDVNKGDFEEFSRNGVKFDVLTPLTALASIWTIIALVLIIIIAVVFKKIKLVILLFKEATKALAAMPMLMLIPVTVTIIQFIVIVLFIVTTIYILAARQLVRLENGLYYYEVNGVIIFAFVFNLVMLNYVARFFAGINYMVISGSVSSWFFTRNKEYLGSPILTSVSNTFKYHLGTVAFGSFLMLLFGFVKMIIKPLCRNACCRCICMMCCTYVDILFQFLSENAYIETGIHGQSYLRSAKRATKLLLKNAKSVIAINCVGDFVLGIIVFLLAIVTSVISSTLFASSGPIYVYGPICFIINLIIVVITFGVFQIIIDTLFICFCEDSVINDGISRPFYMTRGLMEFVEHSKKLYGEKY